jgi:hypothetical protein
MTHFLDTLQKEIGTELDHETLKVQLSITTSESEKFIDELEEVCKKFSIENDYFFNFK